MVLRSVPDGDHNAKSGLVVKNSGFSLHAGVATKAHERDKSEKICRYIERPAVSEERLSLNVRGEVVYKFKKLWDDGTTAIKMTQLEFIEKLVALVPIPRVHLTRFHGALGPHYKYRKQIVPIKKEQPQLAIAGTEADRDKPATSAKRTSWASLLKRVFNIDISICPKCRGQIRIIAAIDGTSAHGRTWPTGLKSGRYLCSTVFRRVIQSAVLNRTSAATALPKHQKFQGEFKKSSATLVQTRQIY